MAMPSQSRIDQPTLRINSIGARMTKAQAYNYRRFTAEQYDLQRFGGPSLGRMVPDFAVQRPNGKRLSFASLRGRPMVLETASLSCPLYERNVGAMQALATAYPGFDFVVLYTREAHPGERLSAHRTLPQKRKAARLLADRDHETRHVIVDTLGGAGHLALGGQPNMLYILDANGVVQYRAAVNDVAATAAALDRLSRGYGAGDVVTRFTAPGPLAVLRTLRRAGWRSVLGFLRATPALVRQLYFGPAAPARR